MENIGVYAIVKFLTIFLAKQSKRDNKFCCLSCVIAGQFFYARNEVAEELDVSVPYAYN